MHKLYYYFENRIYERFILPFIKSVSPINEIALGAAIGIFIGLTPTAGIQMWIVFILWLFFKYVLGVRFDLIIGVALVWISNPFTVFLIYYLFLVTGLLLFSGFGLEVMDLSYNTFYHQFSQILGNPDNGPLTMILEGLRFLLIDLGLPILVGSLCYAIPFSIITYFLTLRYLFKYRRNKALKAGMEYESWRLKYERTSHMKKLENTPN